MTFTEGLGLAGFALSLGLAAREAWRSLLRLQVVPLFRGDPARGHDFLLINRSSQPVFIFNYDIVCAQRKGDPKARILFSLEDELRDMRIESMSRAHLHFANGDFFPWVKADEGRTYFRLWIAGRRAAKWYDVTAE